MPLPSLSIATQAVIVFMGFWNEYYGNLCFILTTPSKYYAYPFFLVFWPKGGKPFFPER